MKTVRTMLLVGALVVSMVIGAALSYVVHDMDNPAYAQLYVGKDGTACSDVGLRWTAQTGTGFVRSASATLASCLNAVQGFTMIGVSSAVNYMTATNAATNGAPVMLATGSDTNVNFRIGAKGTGVVQILGDSGEAGKIVFKRGTAPYLTSCGTGTLSTGSGDIAGEFTATGTIGCTINFGTAWENVPFCTLTVVDNVLSSTVEIPRLASIFTTSITATGLPSGAKATYMCIGRFA